MDRILDVGEWVGQEIYNWHEFMTNQLRARATRHVLVFGRHKKYLDLEMTWSIERATGGKNHYLYYGPVIVWAMAPDTEEDSIELVDITMHDFRDVVDSFTTMKVNPNHVEVANMLAELLSYAQKSTS